MHERGLHVDRQHHAEPDGVDAQLERDRQQQRYDDEGDLEKIEEERQQEHQDVDRDQKADRAAGQVIEQTLHPQVTGETAKGERKHGGADEDENHESGEFQRGIHRLLGNVELEPAFDCRQRQRTRGTQCAALGGGGDTQKNGSQHQKNQHQRRNQRGEYAGSELRSGERARGGWQGGHGSRLEYRHGQDE